MCPCLCRTGPMIHRSQDQGRRDKTRPLLRTCPLRTRSEIDLPLLVQPLEQMPTDTKCICHDRQCGIDRRARTKEAAVDNVQIVDIVCLTVSVEHRCRWVVAEPNRAVLMCDAGERYLLSQI